MFRIYCLLLACEMMCKSGGTLERETCSCQCVAGYTGSECENNIDECDPDPCKNGGTCTDDINGYNCTCVPGYTGSDCEIEGSVQWKNDLGYIVALC